LELGGPEVRKAPFLHRAGLLVCALFCFAALAHPQAQPPVVGENAGTTRSIEGTVLSASGQPVPGARVLLKDTKTLQVRSYIAQSDGRYHFYGLSTDINYQVRAEANGFTSKTKMVSVFDSHKVIQLDLKLTKKMKREG